MRKIGKFKTLAIAGMMAALGVGSSSAQNVSKDSSKSLSGIVAADIRTGDIMQPGIARSEGIVSYGLGTVKYDNIDAFIWTDRNHEDGEWHEVDIGAGYNIPISKNVNARVGGQAWLYPSGLFGDYDLVLDASASYKGELNLEAQLLQRVTDGLKRGTVIMVSTGKSFDREIGGLDVSATPKITAAYNDRFFQESSGIANISPSVEMSVAKGNYFLNGEIGRQIGLDITTKTANYASMGIGRIF